VVLPPATTVEATVLYVVYSAGTVVLAWVVLQLRTWNARQDRWITEGRALAESDDE